MFFYSGCYSPRRGQTLIKHTRTTVGIRDRVDKSIPNITHTHTLNTSHKDIGRADNIYFTSAALSVSMLRDYKLYLFNSQGHRDPLLSQQSLARVKQGTNGQGWLFTSNFNPARTKRFLHTQPRFYMREKKEIWNQFGNKVKKTQL